jgi:hypothetical protein
MKRVCKTCQVCEAEYRLSFNKKAHKYYPASYCRKCENEKAKIYSKSLDVSFVRQKNRNQYRKWSPEFLAKRILQNLIRANRTKEIYWDSELTNLVTTEAHDLRRLRNNITGFEWHVDHIIPLNGKTVSGLHIWNNLQVIPKVVNLTKSNNYLGE